MYSLTSIYRSFANLNKVLLIVILLFIVVAISLYREFIPDDTFIHIGYAKDLSEGKGYSFSGNKTYGSTSPLWPPIIASLALMHVDFENAAQYSSFIFSIAAIFLMYAVARIRFNNLISLSAVCLFCFNVYFLRWSLTGMEATAACFFMLIMIYLLFKEKRESAGILPYIIMGFSPLVRPEFFLFIAIFFLYLFLVQKKSKYTLKLILAMIPTVIWNCFAFVYFGTVVPSTFYSKAGDYIFSTEWSTIIRSVKLFLSGNLIEICFIFLALILLMLNSRQTLRKIMPQIARSEFAVITAWVVSFYLYYTLKNVTILSRYSLVLLPPIILIALFLLNKVCERYKLSQKTRIISLIALVSTSLLVNGLFTVLIVKPDADNFTCGFKQEYKKIASILSNDSHKEGSVALSDVGIIGTYSGLKIYDFVGLVDKDRFRFADSRDYFLNKKPQYLISRGEIRIEDFNNTPAAFQLIYQTLISGMGINQRGNVQVNVYRVFWNKQQE